MQEHVSTVPALRLQSSDTNMDMKCLAMFWQSDLPISIKSIHKESVPRSYLPMLYLEEIADVVLKSRLTCVLSVSPSL